MTKSQKIFAITSGVFFVEALIHYNIGRNKNKKDIKLEMPPKRELIRIVAVVGAFSLVSTEMIKKFVK